MREYHANHHALLFSILQIKPREIYNLGAQSNVKVMYLSIKDSTLKPGKLKPLIRILCMDFICIFSHGHLRYKNKLCNIHGS